MGIFKDLGGVVLTEISDRGMFCIKKPVQGFDTKGGKKDGRAKYSRAQAAAINEGKKGRPRKKS